MDLHYLNILVDIINLFWGEKAYNFAPKPPPTNPQSRERATRERKQRMCQRENATKGEEGGNGLELQIM